MSWNDNSAAAIGGRVRWIDAAKGIGIILVVTAHTSLDYSRLGTYINSFHMPLFFFMSGLVFSPSKYGSFAQLLRSKARTLLVPYAAFASLSFIYFLFRYRFGSASYYEDLSVAQQFFGIFYSAGTREWMDFNLPLWFLTCLFVVEMLYFGLLRAAASPVRAGLLLALCSAIGYADSLYNGWKLPWGADVAFTAVVFYGLGHLTKHRVHRLAAIRPAAKAGLAAALLAVCGLALWERVNLNMKLLSHYFDFYLAASAGVLGTILLSSMIRSRPLEHLGRNALIVMALHMPVLNIASKAMSLVPFAMDGAWIEWFRVGLTIVAILPAIYVINHYMPFLLGRSFKTTAKSGPNQGMSLQDVR